jgi:AcrR family transcriptional regulator
MPDSSTSDLSPRRRPVQQRSQQRFDSIVNAGRDALVETGIEALTCEMIAARAEIPLGSVYQYFPNKFAIVCEMDRLDTIGVQNELDRFASQIPSLEWERLLDALVDHLATLWLDDASRRVVWLSMQATPAMQAVAAIHESSLARSVERLLLPLTPATHGRQRRTVASVLVHTAYSILNFSVRDGQAHPAVVRELKILLTGYLRHAESDSLQRHKGRSAR